MLWGLLVPLGVVALLVGGAAALLVISGRSEGPALPGHYNPTRYAKGGIGAVSPEPRVWGYCEQCDMQAPPEDDHCQICGSELRVVQRPNLEPEDVFAYY